MPPEKVTKVAEAAANLEYVVDGLRQVVETMEEALAGASRRQLEALHTLSARVRTYGTRAENEFLRVAEKGRTVRALRPYFELQRVRLQYAEFEKRLEHKTKELLASLD